jgi:hypothetical protein
VSNLLDYEVTIKGRIEDTSPEVLKRRILNALSIPLLLKDTIHAVEIEVSYTDPFDLLRKRE